MLKRRVVAAERTDGIPRSWRVGGRFFDEVGVESGGVESGRRRRKRR